MDETTKEVQLCDVPPKCSSRSPVPGPLLRRYGITKVHQELLGQYYSDRFGVDYR